MNFIFLKFFVAIFSTLFSQHTTYVQQPDWRYKKISDSLDTIQNKIFELWLLFCFQLSLQLDEWHNRQAPNLNEILHPIEMDFILQVHIFSPRDHSRLQKQPTLVMHISQFIIRVSLNNWPNFLMKCLLSKWVQWRRASAKKVIFYFFLHGR